MAVLRFQISLLFLPHQYMYTIFLCTHVCTRVYVKIIVVLHLSLNLYL